MFGLLRLALGFLFFLIVKKIIKRKTSNFMLFFISVLLTITLSFIPFENVFISFDSPEKSYNYYNYMNKEVKLVIEGQNSDLVIGGEDDNNVNLIVPKINESWKLGLGKDTKMIYQKHVDGYSIHVYQYKSTSEYYVSVLNTNGGNFKITDEYDSTFYSVSRYSDSLDETYYTYYAYIPNFQNQYVLILDGAEISVGYDNQGTVL